MNLKNFKVEIFSRFMFLLSALLFVSPLAAQTQATKLEPGKSLESRIKGGETQVFQFDVKSGFYVRAEVEPQNIHIVVSLLAPDGKSIVEMNGDTNYLWREAVSAIAEKDGTFRLQIKSKEKAENDGNYAVKIAELRKSAALDGARIEAEKNLIQAIAFSQGDKPKEAATFFETSLDLWRKIGDKYWEAVTAWNLAWAYNVLNRDADSLKSFNQALPIFQELKYRVGEGAALGGIGNLYFKSDNFKQAEEYLEKSLVIRKELKRLRSEHNILALLAIVYNGLNQPEKLVASLERRFIVSRELKDRTLERDTLNLLGLYYSKESDSAKAQPYLEQALEIDIELKDNAGESERRLFLANVYGRQKQYEKAQKNMEKALEIAVNTNDRNRESKALSEMGSYNSLILGQFDKAREFLLKALTIKRELNNDKQGEILILNRLALASQGLGDYLKQIEYANQGLELSKEISDKSSQIDLLQSLAIAYQNTGQVDKSLEFFELSVTIARNEKLKLKEIIGLLGLAGFYGGSVQQYEKARNIDEEALKIAKDLGDKSLINLVLSSLGDNYSFLRQYDKALESYEQAVAIARELNDKDRESSNIHSLGLLFAKQRQFDKAQDYFEQALKIADDQKSPRQQIYILSSLGSLFSNQNKFEQAIIYFEKAFKLAVETKNIHWQLSLNAYVGNLYIKLNQYEKAQIYLQKSLTISKESRNVIYEAISYINLGDMYFALNQYEKSRDCFEQVLRISQETNNRWLLGFATSGIGAVYIDLSNNQKAQSSIEQSLSLMRDVSDRGGEGNALNSLGRIYINLNDYDKAQKYFEDSLTIAREIKNKQGEVYPLINLGEVFKIKNQLEKAQGFYEQALSLAIEVKDRTNEGYALNGYGDIRFKNKKYKEAEDFYRQSLAIAKEIQSKKLEGTVLTNLMNLSKELKDTQVAIVYGKQAVNVFQEIRGNIKGFEKESRESYLKDKESVYRTLAVLLISEKSFAEAQMILDLLKQEEYAQLEKSGVQNENVPYNRTEAEVITKIENLAALGREQTELGKMQKEQGDEFPADKRARLEQIGADIKIANAEFEKSLDALSKSEKSVEKQVANIQGEKNLQSALLNLGKEMNTGTVALYTVIGTEEEKDANGKVSADKTRSKFGWVILVTPKDRKAYPIDVTNLEQNVFQLRTALSSDRYDPKPLAQKIYNAIFRQTSDKQKVTLEQDLNDILGKYPDKTLMWSLDGVLRYIPMAALNDGNSYLVEKYRNVVFTKESLLWLMNLPKSDQKILGLGVSAGNKDLNMSALPGVEKELTDVVRQSKETTGILDGIRKLNSAFKKQDILNLKDEENQFQTVHIASHYSFNPADQNASYLLIGDGNGKLTFGDMTTENNLFGTVDLLTLSACDTGVSGNGKEAEGFAYLAQSLGAKSVIASLWKVSDAGTPELMIRFYKLRAEHPEISKGEAFRRAQLSLLNAGKTSSTETQTDKKNRAELVGGGSENSNLPLFVNDPKNPFSHPHYWSSFVLIGNWR